MYDNILEDGAVAVDDVDNIGREAGFMNELASEWENKYLELSARGR